MIIKRYGGVELIQGQIMSGAQAKTGLVPATQGPLCTPPVSLMEINSSRLGWRFFFKLYLRDINLVMGQKKATVMVRHP